MGNILLRRSKSGGCVMFVHHSATSSSSAALPRLPLDFSVQLLFAFFLHFFLHSSSPSLSSTLPTLPLVLSLPCHIVSGDPCVISLLFLFAPSHLHQSPISIYRGTH
ncbi:hypothetical protein BLNAU_14396 [Blattamonas nauphoetae]|uniref:Uncharacterized protein n=1 Tax=Blattamonas nauphoetae TaxID=2049346 RepID=A0ABQ9XKR6_9EUKA|nr:hypothetical protein BLNAU_14396 [Blattamonas nauphoetae]